MPIIFDGPERSEINRIIDGRISGSRKQSVDSAKKFRTRVRNISGGGKGSNSATIEGGLSFFGQRKKNANKLASRSLNRAMGQILTKTGLNSVGNLFASGPAAVTSAIVTGAFAFGNAALNQTLSAIEARKKTRGIFDIPRLPSFDDIARAASEGRVDDAFANLMVKASYGKRAVGGAISALGSLMKSLVNRNNWDRALQDAQQDLWRGQPIPHIEVINSTITMRERFEKNFTRGGDQYGGWKELPVSGN